MKAPSLLAHPSSLIALAVMATGGALAQETPTDSRAGEQKKEGKKPIAAVDYAQWERLAGEQLSDDGKWLVYTVMRVDKEHTLHLYSTTAKKKAKPAASFPQGERPVFSDDSRWLAVTIGKSPAELKKAGKAGASAPSSGGTIKLRHLESGETTVFENTKGLHFSADSRFAAINIVGKSAAKPSAPTKPGTPPSRPKPGPSGALIIRNLAGKTDTTFGNIVRHAWSDDGALLAMVVDSPGISNALQLFDPATGVLRVLDTSDQDYAHLAWREDAMDLAAMREMKHSDKEDVSHVLLAWHDLQRPNSRKRIFEHATSKSFPKEMFITAGGLEWSRNGEAIFVDLKKWEKKPKEEPKTTKAKKRSAKKNKKKEPNAEKGAADKKSDDKSTEKPPAKTAAPESSKAKPSAKPASPKKTLRDSLEANSNVEVWHSKDIEIMPKQKKRAGAEKNPKRRSVWWPGKDRFVQLGTELTESVEVLRSGTHAIGTDRTPHERSGRFGPRLSDIYLINTTTGERRRILESVKFPLSTSPDGRYLLFLRDGRIWSHDVKSGKQRDLTGDLDSTFTDEEDDTLAVEKRPYGRGEWLADGSAVLLYERYDIWMVQADGSGAVKLTNGAEQQVRHRISRASYHEDDDGFLHPKKPLYIALYGDRTKKSGYGRVQLRGVGRTPGKLERLLWEDRQIASLQRAKTANIFTFNRQSYSDSPDLFLSGPNLDKARQVSRTNPFQKSYRWGRSELVDYVNANGVALQGALTYPANYQPGHQYPMIVYIYEKRSQELHRYPVPSETHPYNPAVFSAEGYFVFQPDIVYRPQEPGISAVECVVPAVKQVLESGMIDGERIGLIGHSWGAYQTAFIVTQTDLFAAGVAGAPLTNMMSMSVSVYWNSGEANAAIFSQSQGRMDTPFWRAPENYVRNSPIHSLDNLNTPLLIAFGDKDGAVDFSQGVQMYNAARWAGKDDFVMLVYPGENHSLRKEENAVDYHYRILEWFGHYLQDDQAKKWITEGTSFLERQKELEEKKLKKENAKKPAPKPQK